MVLLGCSVRSVAVLALIYTCLLSGLLSGQIAIGLSFSHYGVVEGIRFHPFLDVAYHSHAERLAVCKDCDLILWVPVICDPDYC